MGIFEDIGVQLKDAMKAQDKGRVTALRGIRAAFLQATKQEGADTLSDEECMRHLRRLEKQRGESIEAFEAGGRQEMADAERSELSVIQSFLPSLADEATTRAWVQEAIAASGAESPRDTGRVMGAIMKAHRDEVDGTLAKRIAQELLA